MKAKKILTTTLVIVISLMAATALTFYYNNGDLNFKKIRSEITNDSGLFPQMITSMTKEPHQNYAFYDSGKLIGYLSDEMILNDLFHQAYKERYQESFPDAKVGLGKDAYVLSEASYYYYNNIDEDIINYINDNELFAVETTKISFSNGAYCYVKDVDIFSKGNKEYLLNFVPNEDYELFKADKLPPELSSHGEKRNIKLSVVETASVSKGFASPDQVLQTVEDVVQYLGYGDKPSVKDYTVARYETIQGVAMQNGIGVENLMTINKDKLLSEEQILAEGEILNVAKFQSPINVVVEQESLDREKILPPTPQIIVDGNYPMNYQEVLVEARDGYQDVRYITTIVNGEELSNQQIGEAIVIETPVRGVIKVGSALIEGYGGVFDWPTRGKKKIICGWMCYPGHRGIDIQPNGSKSYGWEIYAAANGKIIQNSYDGGWGWHVKIKHSNNYSTNYAHMINKSAVSVGQDVLQGDVIGNIGSSGRSTAPHLHFEIYVGGERQNPCLWLGC